MQLNKLLSEAIISLDRAAVLTPDLDARILLQYAAKISQEVIYLNPHLEISQEIVDFYNQLIDRRIRHEPVAKIIGSKSFWKSDFIVNNNVLDPRPDSEVIIESALKLFPNKSYPLNFLDLGSGSGCLLLSLLLEFVQAKGIASDISLDALSITKQNANVLNLENRIFYIQQNWSDALIGKFDLVVSNPPYIPSLEINSLADDVRIYDPILALDGGADGLSAYRYLAKQISALLKPNAYAIMEFGYGQGESVREIFSESNYIIKEMLFDLSGTERAIIVSI